MGSMPGRGLNMRNTFLRYCQMAVVIAAVLAVTAVFTMPASVAAAPKKPEQVTKLKVKEVTWQSVKLKWKKAKHAKSYVIYRSAQKDSGYKKIGTTKKKSYTDKGLTTGTKYWYRVRGVNGDKKGKKSSRVKGTPRLSVPVLNKEERGEGIVLQIGAVDGAEGYVLLRDDKKLVEQSALSYTDTDTEVDQEHSYSVYSYRNVNGKRVSSKHADPVSAKKPKASVKLKNANNVKNPLAEGSGYTIKGSIVSNTTIRAVQIGVMKKDSYDWLGSKTHYVNNAVNALTFDISRADSAVKFGSLQLGTYDYTILVDLADGSSKELKKQEFVVAEKSAATQTIPTENMVFPSQVTKGAQNAVKWAINIAGDNSFAYGKGSRAHHGGCYFCGTNVTGPKKATKGSKWEKTYCCNPFIFAAYAHGAKDAAILKACQKGKCGGMLPGDWTKYGCFATVGKCKDVAYEKLLAGDVIISNKEKSGQYHHVIMYCGDNKYVEAGYEGWGSGTIGVRSDMKGEYKKHYQKYSSCYVMRYTGN